MTAQTLLRLVIDTREQAPFEFRNYPCEAGPGTLPAGDYSVKGMETLVAVERKSLPDLVQCLGRERSRFEAELLRLRGYAFACVVVEANLSDLIHGGYRSKLDPHAALQSILAFQARTRVPFIWCDTRPQAEMVTFWQLQKVLREIQSRYERIVKAHGPLVAA